MDEPHTGRPPTLSKNQLSEIDKDIRLDPQSSGYNQNLWNGKLLSHHIFNKFEVHLSVRQCQRLFHNLGFRQRKPRPISSRCDPSKQEDLKKLNEKVQSRKYEIWSTDECHFHQHGSHCRVWIPKENINPMVFQEPNRFKISVFGSVNVEGGRFEYCILS